MVYEFSSKYFGMEAAKYRRMVGVNWSSSVREKGSGMDLFEGHSGSWISVVVVAIRMRVGLPVFFDKGKIMSL